MKDRAKWDRCVAFHGHACPGLAIGVRVCEAVVERLGGTFSCNEELVCVTENDTCGVDAVQVLLGCTFGKGNLIYRDVGKMAFSFFNRNAGQNIRIALKQNLNRNIDRVVLQEQILSAPLTDLFDFKIPAVALPEIARLFSTVTCELCGEGASENRIRLMQGKKVCLDCFGGPSRNAAS